MQKVKLWELSTVEKQKEAIERFKRVAPAMVRRMNSNGIGSDEKILEHLQRLNELYRDSWC